MLANMSSREIISYMQLMTPRLLTHLRSAGKGGSTHNFINAFAQAAIHRYTTLDPHQFSLLSYLDERDRRRFRPRSKHTVVYDYLTLHPEWLVTATTSVMYVQKLQYMYTVDPIYFRGYIEHIHRLGYYVQVDQGVFARIIMQYESSEHGWYMKNGALMKLHAMDGLW